MTKADLMEEIRTILMEPQAATVSNPWNFTDSAIIPLIRSAIRHLRVRGVQLTSVVTSTGQFTTDPETDLEGMLIATFVAEKLMTGDLMQKLQEGELGVVFRAGSDMLDTKEVARTFADAASRLNSDFQTLLTIALTNADAGLSYGEQTTVANEPE